MVSNPKGEASRGRGLQRRGQHSAHISELVVAEVGLVALKELHSQVAVQPVPLLQIQVGVTGQPRATQCGHSGANPATGGESPPAHIH